MAALELLREQPRRVEKLQRNSAVLREALTESGMPVEAGETPIVPLIVGDADAADARLRAGARAGRVRPGDPPADRARRARSRLRLAVMASHTKSELREAGAAARAAVRAARPAAPRSRRGRAPPSRLAPAVFDGLADAA